MYAGILPLGAESPIHHRLLPLIECPQSQLLFAALS